MIEEVVLKNHILNILDITQKYRTYMYNNEYLEDIKHFGEDILKLLSKVDFLMLIPRYEGLKPTQQQTLEFIQKKIGKDILLFIINEEFYEELHYLSTCYFESMKPQKSKFDEKYGL